MAALVLGIGRFIYKDAARHGMDPWLWATIAVYVPNLIGVILYFVARGRLHPSELVHPWMRQPGQFYRCHGEHHLGGCPGTLVLPGCHILFQHGSIIERL
ncbi:hypothetical protein ABEX25_16440 [Paenibacillus thiaminolyticus]|uniref:hypothetical protein n=1 Tax=Paenibacillus thiaminolyticus TaxID=49283 RepID=UPI003D28D09D